MYGNPNNVVPLSGTTKAYMLPFILMFDLDFPRVNLGNVCLIIFLQYNTPVAGLT